MIHRQSLLQETKQNYAIVIQMWDSNCFINQHLKYTKNFDLCVYEHPKEGCYSFKHKIDTSLTASHTLQVFKSFVLICKKMIVFPQTNYLVLELD